MEIKKVFRTWDDHCLLKLKELGKSTPQKWAESMGNRFALSMSRIIKNNIDKLIVTKSPSGKPKFYEVKEGVEF